MMWNFGGGAGWWGGLVMLASMLLWFAILALLIWGIFRWLGAGRNQPYVQPSSPMPGAQEILSQRYARGEIDTATYQSMRAELERQGPPSTT